MNNSQPRLCVAYLRVSSEDQDCNNQLHGVAAYAAAHSLTITASIRDTASGALDWRNRPVKTWLDEAPSGSILLVAEISRLARSTLQVLEIAQAAVSRELVIVATKNNLTIDGTMASKITTTILGLAAEIEREFIRARTKEALAARRAKGLPLGRPAGSTSPSKLEPRADEIAKYKAKGLGPSAIAKLLDVSRTTLHRFTKRHDTHKEPTP